MIKIEKSETYGWEAAIRGMRNPKNSWDKSDSHICMCRYTDCDCAMVMDEDEPAKECNDGKYGFCIGQNDFELMKTLAAAGNDHGKFLRMITVTVDLTAPLYWWKEFDTYKVGTVADSCSTMHKIHAKEFVLDDFSHEHLFNGIDFVEGNGDMEYYENPTTCLEYVVRVLNHYRNNYMVASEKLKRTDLTDAERKHTVAQKKRFWWQMIQLLPSSYNQKRTVQVNYAVLKNMYHARKNHKLDEWHEFCRWVEALPYSELITGCDGEKR